MKRCVALLVVSPPPVLSLVAQSTCRIFAPGVLRLGPRWPCWRAEAGLTAAIPMDNPYCSCQLTCGPVGVQRQRGSEERSAHAADKAGQDRTRVHTTSTSRTMTHTRSRSHRHTHRETHTQPETQTHSQSHTQNQDALPHLIVLSSLAPGSGAYEPAPSRVASVRCAIGIATDGRSTTRLLELLLESLPGRQGRAP